MVNIPQTISKDSEKMYNSIILQGTPCKLLLNGMGKYIHLKVKACFNSPIILFPMQKGHERLYQNSMYPCRIIIVVGNERQNNYRYYSYSPGRDLHHRRISPIGQHQNSRLNGDKRKQTIKS